jgi:hypothetical protein
LIIRFAAADGTFNDADPADKVVAAASALSPYQRCPPG